MISENIKRIEFKISESCLKYGRNREEIKLIAVSKTEPVEFIREALNSGLKDFGENKALELRDKSLDLKGDFSWHFIGHLQTNKVKYIIDSAEYIHTLDSVKLAEEINRKAGSISKIQKVLLEIKTSDEESKLGLCSEEEIYTTAEFCAASPNLELIGLMTMAPYTDDEKLIRRCFTRLRNIKEQLNKQGFGLTELSMGMTNDYDIAIQEGSTMLRIGTAIFGERNYR